MGNLFPTMDLVFYWSAPLLDVNRPEMREQIRALSPEFCQSFDGIAPVGPPIERIVSLPSDPDYAAAIATIQNCGGIPVHARRFVIDTVLLSPGTQTPDDYYDPAFYRNRLLQLNVERDSMGLAANFWDTERYEANEFTPQFDFLDRTLSTSFERFTGAIQEALYTVSPATYVTSYGDRVPLKPVWPMGKLGATQLCQTAFTVRNVAELETRINRPPGWMHDIRGWTVYIDINEDAPRSIAGRPAWTIPEFLNTFHALVPQIQAVYPECRTCMVFMERSEMARGVRRWTELIRAGYGRAS